MLTERALASKNPAAGAGRGAHWGRAFGQNLSAPRDQTREAALYSIAQRKRAAEAGRTRRQVAGWRAGQAKAGGWFAPPACPRSQPASTLWLADERRMRNVWMAAGRFVGARGIGTWEFLVLK
jgi:hypothetical protein